MAAKLPTKPDASIVVRCKNEALTIRELLDRVFEQTLMSFELIVVDNDSRDGTLEILERYPVATIVSIPDSGFNHAYSCNIGVYMARTNFVVLTNGHCLPISTTWLEDGLSNFTDDKIAAVDGNYRSGRNASKWERLGDIWQADTLNLRRENLPITTTNAIIRRDLWNEYQFDETLPECEDYDWAREMLARGYTTVKDPRFNVYHSHNLTYQEREAQNKRWEAVCHSIDHRERPRVSVSRVFDRRHLKRSGMNIERLME